MAEIFPELDLFPKLTRAANFVSKVLRLPTAPLHMSDHYNPDHFTGASAMLDRALDTQPELPFEGGRWSDMGEYLGRE